MTGRLKAWGGKPTRSLNITIPEDLATELDEAAATRVVHRNVLIAYALRPYLDALPPIANALTEYDRGHRDGYNAALGLDIPEAQ